MKVLIFGGSGYLGSHVFDLLDKETTIIPIAFNSDTGNLLSPSRIEHCLKDLDKNTNVLLCSGIIRSKGNDQKSYDANVQMIRNFLSGLRGRVLKSLIYISSTSIYGDMPGGENISENTALAANDFYSKSKLQNEFDILSDVSHGQFPITILRPSLLYGGHDIFQSLVGRIALRILKGEPVSLRGKGMGARDFLHVNDLAGLILSLLFNPRNTCVNIASGKSVALKDVVGLLSQELNRPVELFCELNPSTEDRAEVFDIHQAKSLFPHQTYISLEDAMPGICKFYESEFLKKKHEILT